MGILKWKTNTRSGCLLKTFTKVMVHRGYVCGGDLNLMLWVMEKQNLKKLLSCVEALEQCKLEDLNYVGNPFNSINNQGGENNV